MDQLIDISISIGITHFKKHSEIKNELMEILDKQSAPPVFNEKNKISRTDWYIDIGQLREYFSFLYPYIDEHLQSIDGFDFDQYKINNYWFQTYKEQDTHDWHFHFSSVWSCIYYVELDDDCPVTEFLNPMTNKVIELPRVKEGDMIIFPAILEHRSPPNKSKTNKTIISFNLEKK